ncbi:hypothetical protein MNBD_GAMMA05-2540 [hydrothermal vent metagenome]|uniref:Uncharacterized protein n=1 Tax=hydrothermal vent metagenome TaxID=652676 RepID=A0A3B0W6M7_9ZZZZ
MCKEIYKNNLSVSVSYTNFLYTYRPFEYGANIQAYNALFGVTLRM